MKGIQLELGLEDERSLFERLAVDAKSNGITAIPEPLKIQVSNDFSCNFHGE